MGNANKKNRNSINTVLEHSLDTSNPILEFSPNDADSDFMQELKNTIKLPRETEIIETEEEIDLEEKTDQIKNYFFTDEEAAPVSQVFRSKTFEPIQKLCILNAPKPKLKIFTDNITPFRLSSKNFGSSRNKNKKKNPIILDFQKTLTDSKSCNDSVNIDDDYFDESELDLDAETTTPSLKDFKNLNNCRKKMAFFRDSLDNQSKHSVDENEKIEYIFTEKKNKIKKNKKNKYIIKHIKQQTILSKKAMKLRLSMKPIKKSETVKNQNLCNKKPFILGVLEGAAKEIKMKSKSRYTSIV
jgi:hypothetical protein